MTRTLTDDSLSILREIERDAMLDASLVDDDDLTDADWHAVWDITQERRCVVCGGVIDPNGTADLCEPCDGRDVLDWQIGEVA